MKVWLVGAGPGDPDLITRKAWKLLNQADVILHDALMDIDGMKESNPTAKWVEVGKRNAQPSVAQTFICRSLIGFAKQGLRVVRLKGGDPSIFGRASDHHRQFTLVVHKGNPLRAASLRTMANQRATSFEKCQRLVFRSHCQLFGKLFDMVCIIQT